MVMCSSLRKHPARADSASTPALLSAEIPLWNMESSAIVARLMRFVSCRICILFIAPQQSSTNRPHAIKLTRVVIQTARLFGPLNAGRFCPIRVPKSLLLIQQFCSNVVGGQCCSTSCQLVGYPNISSVDYSSSTYLCQDATDCTLAVYCIADPIFGGKCPSVDHPYENNYNVANCSWNTSYTGNCFLVCDCCQVEDVSKILMSSALLVISILHARIFLTTQPPPTLSFFPTKLCAVTEVIRAILDHARFVDFFFFFLNLAFWRLLVIVSHNYARATFRSCCDKSSFNAHEKIK